MAASDRLVVERQIVRRGEECDGVHEDRDEEKRRRARLEHARADDGPARRMKLPHAKCDKEDPAKDDRRDCCGVVPAVRARLAEADEHERCRDDDEEEAEKVALRPHLPRRRERPRVEVQEEEEPHDWKRRQRCHVATTFVTHGARPPSAYVRSSQRKLAPLGSKLDRQASYHLALQTFLMHECYRRAP